MGTHIDNQGFAARVATGNQGFAARVATGNQGFAARVATGNHSFAVGIAAVNLLLFAEASNLCCFRFADSSCRVPCGAPWVTWALPMF